jgi:hypothetical protein
MDAVYLLRQMVTGAHELLESTVGDLTPEQLHYDPPGRALPIGAAYAHVLFSEDLLVQSGIKGEQPLYESGVATGASEPMPNFLAGEWDNYAEWTRRARFDLAALREYARQVYANTENYINTLTEEDLNREVPNWGTIARVLSRTVAAHADNLAGEISAVKGLQGLQGYPF